VFEGDVQVIAFIAGTLERNFKSSTILVSIMLFQSRLVAFHLSAYLSRGIYSHADIIEKNSGGASFEASHRVLDPSLEYFFAKIDSKVQMKMS
jgi:ABC-type uncharacterized transport system permease subunit